MPIITPPSNEFFESDSVEPLKETKEEVYWRYRKTQIYMDCKNWKCPECGCNVFGRCKTCPYCRHKLGKITNRPLNWTR